MTRENSGGNRSQNNNQDPTLREREAEAGQSGEAIAGKKGVRSPGAKQRSPRETR